MRLTEIDLNLLLVFDQLIKKRSVSAVAESMNVSQPAVSNALKRLRKLLDDDLFVRGKRGMEPTIRAEQLAEPVGYALDTLEQAIRQQDTFDPTTAKRSFDLAMTEVDDYFLPPLLSVLEKEAPLIRLNLTEKYRNEIKDSMEHGIIDLAFGNFPQLEGDFYRRRLFRDRVVLVMRKGHPLSERATIDKKEFSEFPHIVVRPEPERATPLEKMLEREHIDRDVRLAVDNVMMVGSVLQNSDLIATLPERLAMRLCGPYELLYKPHPIDLPERSIDMYWHARVHRDRAVTWLRKRILELFSDF